MLNVCHLASIHDFKYTTDPHAPVRLMYHYRRKQSSTSSAERLMSPKQGRYELGFADTLCPIAMRNDRYPYALLPPV